VPPEEDAAFGKSQRQDGASAPTYRGFFFAPERGIMPDQSLWQILPGSPASNLVIHVPHGGLVIPQREVPTFKIADDDLEAEAKLMADIGTDILARKVYKSSTIKPWAFINRLSRLVVDPERFTDESEEMNAVGMGFSYTRTSDQRELRVVSGGDSQRLLQIYFEPYSNAFQELVGQLLQDRGSVTIIDLHSYAVEALPYELHKTDKRPGLCIGTDDFHTGTGLIAAARSSFERYTSVALNEPFSGTYVPLAFYGQDSKVQSLMLEIRKDTYGFGDAASAEFERTVGALVGFVRTLNEVLPADISYVATENIGE
jgi:N-formylglutamate deformylase